MANGYELFADLPDEQPLREQPAKPSTQSYELFADLPDEQLATQPAKPPQPARPAVSPDSYNLFADLPSAETRLTPEQRQITFMEAAGRGLASGAIGVMESVGTGARWLGGRIDSKSLSEIGLDTEQFWARLGAEYEPPPEIQGSIYENPALLSDSSWWAYNVANMVPSLAAALIPGGAAYKGIKIAGKALSWTPATATKLAALGASITGGTVGGALEGTGTYREVLRRGGTEQEAARSAELMFFAATALNALSVGKLVSPTAGRLRHMLTSGMVEGITEWLEEPAEAAILGDDMLEAAKQGLNVLPPAMITGGLFGGVVSRRPTEPQLPTQEEVEKTLKTQPSKVQPSFEPGERYKGRITPAEIEKRFREMPKDTVIRREKILKPLMKDLGMPLYQGRMERYKRFAGFFRPSTGELRIKERNDIEVTAHEIAHLIDHRDPMFKKAYRKKVFRKEIKGVSYDAKSLSEGFAEFMRLYLTDEPAAVERAPKFYEWFSNAIRGSKYEKTLARAQKGMHDWYEQGALKQFISKGGAEKEGLMQRFRDFRERWRDVAIANVFDSLHGIKLAVKDIMGNLEGDTNPYRSWRLLAGIRSVIRAVYEHGTIGLRANGDVEFTGKGLRHVFEEVSDDLENTFTYFRARRAAELTKQRREKLHKPHEIKAALALADKNPAIKRAFERYQEFNKRMLDFAVQSGILSEETRAKFDEMGKDYVPFYRVVEEVTGERVYKSKKPFHRLSGGTANVGDILDNITTNAAMIIDAGFRNIAKRNLYNMLERSEHGARYATRIAKVSKPVFVNREQLEQKMKKLGVERIPENIEDVVTFFTFGHAPQGKNIDMFMRAGKPQYYEIADTAPLFLKAVQSFGPKPLNIAMNIAGGFKRVLTRLVTLDPGFMLVNLIRDSGSAFLLSKSGFTPFIDSVKGFASRMRKSDAYWEFMINGGGFSSFIHGETGVLRRDIERFYTKRGIDYKTVLDSRKKILDMLDEFSSGFEYGARLEEYKRLRAQGKTAQQAAFGAREVSTDFAMRGASNFVQAFVQTVPFLGARLQGLYRIGRAAMPKQFRALNEGERMAQLWWKGLLGITFPSLVLYGLFEDDERYKALPDWVKDLHWVFFLPGVEKPFLIPKPFELGAAFATVPERAFEYYKTRDGKQFFDALKWIISEQMELNYVPQIIKPFYDIGRNETFTGAPVIPADLKDVAAHEQYRPWTSETLVGLSKHLKDYKVNMSPLKVETLLRGYFGTLGTYLLQVSDAVVRGVGENEAPTRRLDEWPVVRRFVRNLPLRHTDYEDDFYRLADETREAVETVRKIIREGRAEGVKSFLTDDQRRIAFGMEQAVTKVQKEVAKINGALRIVRLNKKLSAEEKRKRTDALLRQKERLLRQSVTSLKAGKKQLE